MICNKRLLLPLLALLLASCGQEKKTDLQDAIITAGPLSLYDLSKSQLPFPNDLLFKGSLDGTLNIAVEDESNFGDPLVAINGLDGFSTMAPISTQFSGSLEPSSITGRSVRLYEVVLFQGPGSPIQQVLSQLVFGSDYLATAVNNEGSAASLVIMPLKPLKAKTAYAVVLTNALKGLDGKAVQRSSSYLLTRGAAPLVNTAPSEPISHDDIYVGSMKPAAAAAQIEIDQAYWAATSLESLRANVVYPSEQALIRSDAELSSAQIILHWGFTTQSVSDVLQNTRSQVRAMTAKAGFSEPATGALDSPMGLASMKVGQLQIPYFLSAADTTSSPSYDASALSSFWQGPELGAGPEQEPSALSYLTNNLSPQFTSMQTIPMLVSIPKVSGACVNGMPDAGWPVVIFQHGITADRSSMFAIADALASACFAGVAIDLPMHGITGNEGNALSVLKDKLNGERTFDLDLLTQDFAGNTLARAADGWIDGSGSHFINLTSLLNTRDNVRQAVSDLFMLTWAIESGKVTDGVNKLNAEQVYFAAHSLGAIVGTAFLALEPKVRAAVLVAGGGGIAKLLDGSAKFGPSISVGLEAASGFAKGSADYEGLIGLIQTVIDSADPINYAGLLADTQKGILFHTMVGGGTANNASDVVVPNRVPDSNDDGKTQAAPLAGTKPLLSLLNLTQSDSARSADQALRLAVNFSSGNHSSLFDPSLDAAVTVEMQSQLVSFLASDGKQLAVNEAVRNSIIELVED